MRIVLFIAGVLLAASGMAQDILQDLSARRAGEGTVEVHQDAAIAALIGKPVMAYGTDASERKTLRAAGYRVQVYAGNNSRKAREEASAKGAQVKETFPELPVYASFVSPRWLCRVGDFKSIEEADALMRRLRATGFKEASIVKDVINITL